MQPSKAFAPTELTHIGIFSQAKLTQSSKALLEILVMLLLGIKMLSRLLQPMKAPSLIVCVLLGIEKYLTGDAGGNKIKFVW